MIGGRRLLENQQSIHEKEEDISESFSYIALEIKRQFDLEMDFDNASDTKIGIFLGFIVIVLTGLALNVDMTSMRKEGAVSFILFFTGIQFILISGWKAEKAFGPREYPVGHKLDHIFSKYKNDKNMQKKPVLCEIYITSKMAEASEEIELLMKEKKRLIKSMQNFFFYGIVLILISQISNILGV